MTFLAPLWLLGALPWLGLAAWLMLGRPKRQRVPFLPLWQGPVPSRLARRKFHAPPLALLLALLALLLAILGAARPVLNVDHARGNQLVTIVVDCGATMSAQVVSGPPRFALLADEAFQPLLDTLGPGPVELIDVPRGSRIRSNRRDWRDAVHQLATTGLDTPALIRPQVSALLAEAGGPVVVLTDHPVDLSDDRLIVISPTTDVINLDIVRIAARDGAHPQVMVTVRNESDEREADLRLLQGDEPRTPIDLPPRGGEKSYFLDAAKLEDVVEMKLDPGDPLYVDNRAWLVRERNSPRLEARFPLPDALRRMLDVYEKLRPSRDGSPRVGIVPDPGDLPIGEPGIAVSEPSTEAPRHASADVTITPHPVTANLSAADFAGARLSQRVPPSTGWQTLLSIGGQPAVMVRSDPAHEVWVGFDAPTWGRAPAFVIFWTNVFDWVGGSSNAFASYPLTQWEPQWQPVDPDIHPGATGLWPGVYRNPSGELRAFNTLDLHTAPPPPSPWRKKLRALAASQPRGLQVSPSLYLIALAAFALAALSWRRRIG